MRPKVHLILPDVHCPFHNAKLIGKICSLAREIKPDCLILSGDFLDMYSLSRFNEGSLARLREWDLTREYEVGSGVLDRIVDAVPRGCEKHYLWGNHESRFEAEMEKGDKSKYGGELTSPSDGLGLPARGFKVCRDWMNDAVRIGPHLEVIHGTYATVHTAKKHLDEFEGSVMMGHSHRFQCYVTGKRGAYNIGFLGDMDSNGFLYLPRSQRLKWVNAFAVVYLLDDGYFLASPVQCYNSRFVFNGKLY